MPDEVRRLRSYLLENYTQSLTLDKMSQVAALNKYYLEKLFKKYVGYSPTQYLIHLRLTKSKELLRSTSMIEEGDRIAVGVSGGKDSLTLLAVLAALRAYYPKHFELEAVTVDMGLEGMDFSGVEAFCREREIPYTLVHTEIGKIIFDYREEKNPCSLCAKMRRGALHDVLLAHGCNKIALGHHYDDAVETFLMSLFYEGRISCFEPVTYLTRTGITQIRPMLYIGEKAIAHFAEREGLPVVHNTCPADKHTKRQEVKELIASLQEQYPDLKTKLFGAMTAPFRPVTLICGRANGSGRRARM